LGLSKPRVPRINAAQRMKEARAKELSGLSRVIVHAFPKEAPKAVVLLDVVEREIETSVGADLGRAAERLSGYDLIGAVDVRRVLRALGFDPGVLRLAELGPPQKTKRLNRRGRTLKITLPMLIRGSCGIGRPLGDPKKLRKYIEEGQTTRLRRRLEADAKAIFAYYQYGRLHGGIRLRWGFLDEMIPAPWAHPDETSIYDLKRQALEKNLGLEVVCRSAPGWAEPWSRARRCRAGKEPGKWYIYLVDEDGEELDDRDIQLARLVPEGS
jgi:hypothetical protein